jgi:sugar lactone lactonase YvrE
MLGNGLRTLVSGLDHPEGVCWCPRAGQMYAGGEAGQLYRFGVEGGEAELVTTVPGGFLLGLAVDADGDVFACDPPHGHVQRITPDGRFESYGGPMELPNYPAFDEEGNLWVSDSGAWDEPTGQLWRIAPGGDTELAGDGFRYSNGLAVRGEHLYMVESRLPGVVRIPLAGGAKEVIVELPRTVPDGIAFDAQGGLWISYYEPHRITRLHPSGELEMVVDDWTGEYVTSPTNVAFSGPDLDVLVMASLSGWAVRAIDPGVPGQPLHRPGLAQAS